MRIGASSPKKKAINSKLSENWSLLSENHNCANFNQKSLKITVKNAHFIIIESKNGYFKYFHKTQVNKRVAGNFERLSKSKNDCLPTKN